MKQPWPARFLAIAGVLGAAGVAMAAIAAHALAHSLDDAAKTALHSAVDMQMWHALALAAASLWLARATGPAHRLAAAACAGFTLGTLLFCGAVYIHALTGHSLGPTAPTGGILLMAAWLTLSASALTARPQAGEKSS